LRTQQAQLYLTTAAARLGRFAVRAMLRRMKLTIVDKARLLRGVPLFSEVPTEVLADLATLASDMRFEEPTTLFRKGELADAFFLVVGGHVRASRDGSEVHRAGPGEEVGALAVLDRRPRAFSAEAEEASNLLRIAADDFHYLLEQHPSLARGVVRYLALEVRKAFRGVGRLPS
jgi:CRP/FNR family cyclic AMP-dependent transcriptional regulator